MPLRPSLPVPKAGAGKLSECKLGLTNLLSGYLLNSEVVDEVVVMLIQVAVQGDTVALIQQVLQGVDPLHAQRPLYPIL